MSRLLRRLRWLGPLVSVALLFVVVFPTAVDAVESVGHATSSVVSTSPRAARTTKPGLVRKAAQSPRSAVRVVSGARITRAISIQPVTTSVVLCAVVVALVVANEGTRRRRHLAPVTFDAPRRGPPARS